MGILLTQRLAPSSLSTFRKIFQSNQISSLTFNSDTSLGARGGSGGTNSCWLATYNTPNEMPTVSITAPAAGGVYVQGSVQASAYTCAAVNNSNVNGGVAGPYLTVTSCSGPVPSGTDFDTSTTGPHSFTVNVEDSALNVNRSEERRVGKEGRSRW